MTLTVIVAWRESAATLRRCLDSLESQTFEQLLISRTPEAEFSEELRAEFPLAVWLEPVAIDDLPQLYWRALPLASGDIVATLEAASITAPEWAAAHVACHLTNPQVLACGGPVRIPERASQWQLAWYWSEFAAYAQGRAAGLTQDLTDANVSYKRGLLLAEARLLSDGAWGWRLRRQPGRSSYFEPAAWIEYAAPASAGSVGKSRVEAGRRHGSIQRRTLGARVAGALLAPLLPAVLTWRGWRAAASCGRSGAYLRAAPQIVMLHGCWALGEWLGAVLGKRH